MRITGRLGSLALSDDCSVDVYREEFKQILSIEGSNFAEFRYQTYDPEDEGYTGVKSAVYLAAGSLKVHFLEQPFHDMYLFVTKLAKLKTLYDAARDAAVQKASEIERMQFEISVKTPIVVFPSDPARLPDIVTMRLGEVFASNSFDGDTSRISASLNGLQLASDLYYDGKLSTLKIVDDISIVANVYQRANIDHSQANELPDTQVSFVFSRIRHYSHPRSQVIVKISDIKLHLTQIQYEILVTLSQSIPRVLAGTPEGSGQAVTSASSLGQPVSTGSEAQLSLVNLEPEIRLSPTPIGSRPWTTIDLVASIATVKLHLYDRAATTEANLKDHGIARFALNDVSLRSKLMSHGAFEAQLVLRSFTMSNTRPGGSKFREIVPAADHERNQFMVLYTSSGASALAVMTVDAPYIIFSVEPIFALLSFFTSGSPGSNSSNKSAERETTREPSTSSTIDLRFELHDVSISVLEDDTDTSSQAIRLRINQILMSQQVRVL